MRYKKLDWDSDFFGYSVVYVEVRSRNEALQLKSMIMDIKRDGVKLIYISSDFLLELESPFVFLVDKKVTLTKNEIHSGSVCSWPVGVEIYNRNLTAYDYTCLESLAIQSGKFSRFNIDSNIPKYKFNQLYKTWLYASIENKVADSLFFIRAEGEIVAFITVSNKNRIGDIGLLAVDKDYRGRGYSKKLISAANAFFRDNNVLSSQVVTQLDNKPAMKLYEKVGFKVDIIKYYYHCWL